LFVIPGLQFLSRADAAFTVDFALVIIARIPRVLLLSSGAEEPVSERTLI